MASNNIKGITVEIGGNTGPLKNALKDVDKQARSTQSELSKVGRLLKFNPGNVELLKQKQDALTSSVKNTSERLKTLRAAQEQYVSSGKDLGADSYKALQREIIESESKLKHFENELKKFGSVGAQRVAAVGAKFKSVGSKITNAGMAVSRSLGVMSAAAVYAGKQAIDAATTQQNAENKLTEIYRSRMGATRAAAKATEEYASKLQREGVVGDEVTLSGAQQLATFAKMPETVNKLLPAMDNLLVQQKGYAGTAQDATQIANLMGKAMNGNVGALKRVGISFTDAQADVIKYGTESEKAAMLSQVITDNVGEMNSKFAGTDLGKIQQAKNVLGDTAEELGAVLLPAVAEAAKWISANLVPKLSEMISICKQHPVIAKVALALTGIGLVIGPLIVSIGSFATSIGAIASAAPDLLRFGSVLTRFGSGIAGAFTAIPGIIAAAGAGIRAFGVSIAAALGPVGLIIAGIAAAVAVFVLLWHKSEGFRNFWKGLWKGIKSTLSSAVTAIKHLMKGLASFFGNVWKGIKSAVVTIVKGFVNAIVTVIKVKFAVIKAALTLLKHAFSLAFKGIRTLAGILLNALRAVFSKIKGVFSKVKSFLSWFGGLGKKAYNWGKDLVGGFIKGLASHVKSLYGKVKGIASFIAKHLHFSVPEEGPLKDFDKSGADMVDLFTSGISSRLGALKSSVSSMAGTLAGASPGYGTVSLDTSGLTDAVRAGMAVSGANLSQPVYCTVKIGETTLESQVVNAVRKVSRRSGGY